MSSSVKIIKRRIRSARNIKQITKAMEMVSAAKMRRAQEKALTTRPYSTKIREVLGQLSGQIDTLRHPMLRDAVGRSGSIGVILIATDRGLAGALNTNLFRELEMFIRTLEKERREEVISFEYIAVGRKAREYILSSGSILHAEFTHFPEKPQFEDILPIARLSLDGFLTQKFKEVYVVYTGFVSILRQEVHISRILPVEKVYIDTERERPREAMKEYIFEPDADAVLEALLPHYIEMQIYQVMLEALASEHSARMVAMRNASDNATEIISELTLDFNKQRQQVITAEISDMVTSRLAVSG